MVPVSSEEEALRQFFLGEQARSTAQHALNTNSSRSHALFTLRIEMRASAEAEERALLSKLHLVDLAGEQAGCAVEQLSTNPTAASHAAWLVLMCWNAGRPGFLPLCFGLITSALM
jgi:hypothetical protein